MHILFISIYSLQLILCDQNITVALVWLNYCSFDDPLLVLSIHKSDWKRLGYNAANAALIVYVRKYVCTTVSGQNLPHLVDWLVLLTAFSIECPEGIWSRSMKEWSKNWSNDILHWGSLSSKPRKRSTHSEDTLGLSGIWLRYMKQLITKTIHAHVHMHIVHPESSGSNV